MTDAAPRYRWTIIFEAEDDADALSQEDDATEAFHSVVDARLETLEGRQL